MPKVLLLSDTSADISHCFLTSLLSVTICVSVSFLLLIIHYRPIWPPHNASVIMKYSETVSFKRKVH